MLSIRPGGHRARHRQAVRRICGVEAGRQKTFKSFVPGCVPHRHAAGTYKLTVAAWRTVPSTFIRPLDSATKPHVQDVFAARATEVIEIEGDHFPHWRRPREVAEIFARIARQVGSTGMTALPVSR